MSTALDTITEDDDGIEDRVNENFGAVGPAAAFALHQADSAALHLALYEGLSPLTGNQVAAYETDLTAATTNYVQLNRNDTVTRATSAPAGWPTALADGAWAIGVAVAGASTFTWTDVRRFGAPPILGIPYAYSSTTASADPGSGTLRFNNATLASATALYISETDGLGRAIAAVIALWDDGAAVNKSQLTVSKTSDPTKFAVFNVTGTNTDNGAWDTVNLSYVTGAGALANGDTVTLTVMATGAAGAGDFVGPAVATSGSAVLFDGTTGKLGKDSKVILTIPAAAVTLTIASGKTATINNSITLAGTDATVMTFPGTSASVARIDAAQSFVGVQTFASAPIFSAMTAGSILFAGASGLLSQNNAAFLWDDANLRLNIGGAASTANRDVFLQKTVAGTMRFFVQNLSNGTSAIGGYTAFNDSGASVMSMVVNSTGFTTAGLLSAGDIRFAATGGKFLIYTTDAQPIVFATALTNESMRLDPTTGVTIKSGVKLQLGNAATTGLVAGVLAATTNASIVITDSAGQAYRIPCII